VRSFTSCGDASASDEVLRNAAEAEAADDERRAVRHVADGLKDFVDHPIR
jgi:hypothetical protein